MNRTFFTTTLCAALIAAPVAATAQDDREQRADKTQRIFGQLLGAGVGALLGSQVGGGKGKLAAVAVGALTGAWLGGQAADRLTPSDRQGIARTTSTALDTGESQSWTNPDTGVQTHVKVKDATVERSPIDDEGLRSRPWQSPPLDYVNATYVATTTSNVRAGPSTDFAVMDTVRDGQRVTVVGKVKGEDWYMIAEDGVGVGYVYAPLLRAVTGEADSVNALRAAATGSSHARFTPERECALITQEIILPDGTREARDMRACQNPDGSWEAVS